MEKRDQNQKMMKNEKSSNVATSWHLPTHRRIDARATEGKTYVSPGEDPKPTSYNVS